MNTPVIALIALLVGVLFSCGADERPKLEAAPVTPPAPQLEPPAAAPGAVTPSEAPEPSAAELPVAEDFEAEAIEQITSENFRTHLKALEKQIAADKP